MSEPLPAPSRPPHSLENARLFGVARLVGLGVACLVGLTGLLWLIERGLGPMELPPERLPPVRLPDFRSIASVDERKDAFFTFLLPFAEAANAEILRDREQLRAFRSHLQAGRSLRSADADWVRALSVHYRLPEPGEISVTEIDQLLGRVDVIPASLALAQAALESAWGTSRFAREGNNLFGMWCYTPGCGIVPARRPAGARHEVARYDSPEDSFAAYVHNLNTNAAYEPLRRIRRDLRARGQPIGAYALAPGLIRYSQEREVYVRKVRSLVRVNDLARFDHPAEDRR
ncbi:MAG: glucosaminidase domain-containing protein [Opitutales bacterium]|nr:glucosaminidase domain-containing protein [Opitutales bacterium]